MAFFEFLQLEVPAVIKRWREHKGSLLDER